MSNFARRFGPGFFVTAAFIGPGTVTTASLAGANYGYALAWVILFALFATLVLQHMAVRIGVAGNSGLAEELAKLSRRPLVRVVVFLVVILAIGVGNAVYQAGNLTGAAMGLSSLLGAKLRVWVLIVLGIAFVLLWTGTYRRIERVLVSLVAVMGLTFGTSAILIGPDLKQLAAGFVLPSLPQGSLLTVIALIGTTVVPYNLFLHADVARKKWGMDQNAGLAARDTFMDRNVWLATRDAFLAITIGGVITLAIMVSALPIYIAGMSLQGLNEISQQLEPVLGRAAGWFFALGLFAAGLTSAITAPMASAYALAGLFGWEKSLVQGRARLIWITVLVAGGLGALSGGNPIQLIVLAQAANGIGLPIIAVLLLLIVNKRQLLGVYANGWIANLLGVVVVLITGALSATQLIRLLT